MDILLLSAPVILEQSTKAGFAVRNGKKSPNQETGLGNKGPLEALNDTKLILEGHAHLGPIWHYSESSDVP